jgi:hypothetical protein
VYIMHCELLVSLIHCNLSAYFIVITQTLMSVWQARQHVIRIATTQLAVSRVVATLGTPSTVIGSHVLVCISLCCNVPLAMISFVIDNNECRSNSSNACQHNCTNTAGSYSCSCNSGFRLNTDGRTCTGENLAAI